MKKLILIIFTLLSLNAYSQESQNVTLRVILRPIQSIIVNQKDVLLEYITLDDYKKGVSKTMENHLTVYSTVGYSINVKGNDLKANSFEIKNTDISINQEGLSVVNLTSDNKELLTSNEYTTGTNYNITYSTEGNNKYFTPKYVKNQTYYTTVTYTITPN